LSSGPRMSRDSYFKAPRIFRTYQAG
jgi:hypothetical protein